MKKFDIFKKLSVGIIIGVISVIIVSLIIRFANPSVFEEFEFKTIDQRIWYREKPLIHTFSKNNVTFVSSKKRTIEDIIILDIDCETLKRYGRFGQWPRTRYAQLLDILSEGGAKVIAFDVLFIEPDRDAVNDTLFANSIKNTGNVYLAFNLSDESCGVDSTIQSVYKFATSNTSIENYKLLKSHTTIETPLPILLDSAKGAGHVKITQDEDGKVRSMQMFLKNNGKIYPSLSLVVASAYLDIDPNNVSIDDGKYINIGGKVKIPIRKEAKMTINYTYLNPRETFRYISLYKVLDKKIKPTIFKDKIVLIGTSAVGLADLRVTPVEKVLPGVEVHANIINNIIKNKFVISPSILTSLLIALLVGIALGSITILVSGWISGIISLVFWLLYIIISLAVFYYQSYTLEILRPTFTIFFVFSATTVYRYLTEERMKSRIKGMFEHYMSPEVVDKLIAKPEMLRLGGEKKELTVLFSDVQGFTTISERLKPEQLVDLLNVYLGAMTELIMKSGGTLDKYEGDAIMAFWGAPVDQPDNAKRACFTAIDMQKKLSQMREVWKKEGKPELITRIGLNTGEMIVGNMGSAERFDYTVMGDAVNLGSRLEGANKQYGTNIMIGEMTYLRAKDYIITRELDKITVKGKLLPVKVYELIAKKEDGISKEMEELLNLYNEGLKAYTERRWNDGILLFSKALEIKPDDGPSKTYLERCQNYLNNPPPDDWDGVYVMKTK